MGVTESGPAGCLLLILFLWLTPSCPFVCISHVPGVPWFGFWCIHMPSVWLYVYPRALSGPNCAFKDLLGALGVMQSLHPCGRWKQNHRIIEPFELEGIFKAIWSNSPAVNMDSYSSARCSEPHPA